MTTLTKLLAAAIAALLLTSCNFDMNFGEGKRGNGNVVSETRNVSEDFEVIKAQEGLDVYVTQGDVAAIEVEADENIIELIATDIKDGVLRVHAEESIGRASSKKVYVTTPTIKELDASSGADIVAKQTIKADKIALDTSSGADIRVTVNATEVSADASSGSDIVVEGNAEVLIADSSSGADIKAGNLLVKKCIADASSGSDITVHVTEDLKANASSGADIRYRGNPEKISKNKSASGSVYKQ